MRLLSTTKVCRGWRERAKKIWRETVVPVKVTFGFVASMLQKCLGIVRLCFRMESDFDSTMLACVAFSCPNLESMEISIFGALTIRINGYKSILSF
ncbi:hypothetical protein LR48_Vigan11g065500 [Vigna angularis]|uniref:Uncharacterized protein n=1 Tax=Phaseolus angularis TaxID=3914 RepID=A0A0L9VRX9_PHAAN|nr:hypothetical protein LR48_Vigan11g065500 [Vigna angularis]